MGGTSGLLRIKKDITFDDTTYPTAEIMDIQLDGVSILNKISPNSTLSIPWNHTSLSIKVMMREKDIFRKKMLRFNIIGLNNIYNIESYDHTLTLHSLPSGNYDITVSCTTQDGSWTLPISILTISVTPPWWRNPWFILSIALVIIGSIILIFMFSIKRKENKNMIERYSRPEMANIWTEENKYRAWLEVEILADEAWAELGEIPKEDVALIREKADFDIDRILEIEQQTRHDVVAFTRAVSETLGEERKWVHYGLTSTDVVDTAYGYLYKQANDIIRKDLENFLNIIADKAKEHKFTIMMGRTHGVHAEPTTFGLKLATWYSEMKRNIERFEHAAAGVEAGKISGAVGNFANIPPFVEKYVCDKLGIRAQEISTQVLPRDLHAEYFAVLASIATSIERMATEIRGLQKSEQREVEEFFAKGQKGSSAMPHKRNPIGSENMTGLARVIRGHMVTAYENVALWHERDISHSSAERIIAPDTTILIDYMLNRFGNIVKNLTVFPENMIRNMNSTFGLIFSQRAMLTLIEKGMTREQAYDLVQPKTAQSWDNQVDFKPLLESDPEVTSRLTQEEIDEIFNPVYYTKRVDEIFERIGLGD